MGVGGCTGASGHLVTEVVEEEGASIAAGRWESSRWLEEGEMEKTAMWEES